MKPAFVTVGNTSTATALAFSAFAPGFCATSWFSAFFDELSRSAFDAANAGADATIGRATANAMSKTGN